MLVTVGPRKREGGEVDLRAGSAGFTGGCENAKGSGTVDVSKFVVTQVKNTVQHTLLTTRVMTRSYLPLPYPLQVFSSVD